MKNRSIDRNDGSAMFEDDYSGFVTCRLSPNYEAQLITDWGEELPELYQLVKEYSVPPPQHLIDPKLINPNVLLNIEKQLFPGVALPNKPSDQNLEKDVGEGYWHITPEFPTDVNLRQSILAQWGWNRQGFTLPNQEFEAAMNTLFTLANRYGLSDPFILPATIDLIGDDLDGYAWAIQTLNDLHAQYAPPSELPAPTVSREYRRDGQSSANDYHSLTAYWQLDMRQASPDERRILVEALNRREEIGLAYEELAVTLPQPNPTLGQDRPDYLGAAGLNVGDDLLSQVVDEARKVNFGDVELGWDLGNNGNSVFAQDIELVIGINKVDEIAHGTAVLGIVLGGVDGTVRGMGFPQKSRHIQETN
jgi:hypothetical protein